MKKYFLCSFIGLIIFGLNFSVNARVVEEDFKTYKLPIETKFGQLNFEIHANPDDRPFAMRVSEILKEDGPKIVSYFQYAPKDIIHISIVGINKTANGSASVFPFNSIVLYNYPPLFTEHLASNRDWIRGLVVHEFVHILHMDRTEGLIDLVRTIFGTAGKWGGIVPRWFTEGIAVWAESNQGNGGRNNDGLLDFEVNALLLDPNFCDDISCLDIPGSYPGGSTPYWLGGRFLEYLENVRKGTIACLVKENADNIPFSLNYAFEECVDDKLAKEAYKEYVLLTKERIERSQDEYQHTERAHQFQKIPLRNDKNYTGMINWQAGAGIVDGNFFFQRLNDDTSEEFLEIWNGKKRMRVKMPENMETFSQVSDHSRKNKRTIIALQVEGDDEFAREWYLWQFDKKKLGKKVPVAKDAQSVVEVSDDHYLILRYSRDRWVVDELKKGKQRLIFRFPQMEQVRFFNVEKVRGKNYMNIIRTSKQGKAERWERIDIKDTKIIKVLSGRREHTIVGTCMGSPIVKEVPSKKKFKNVVGFWGDNKKSVYLFREDPQNAYVIESDCRKLVKMKIAQVFPSTEIDKSYVNDAVEWESFPSLHHYKPHYWFFGFDSANNLDYMQIGTSITDPLGRHYASALVNNYYPVSQTGGIFNYFYNKGLYSLGMNYSKTYSSSALNNQVNINEGISGSVGVSTNFGRWNYNLSLYREQFETVDFISSREYGAIGLNESLSIKGKMADSFMQTFNINGYLRYQDTEGGEGFWGLQLNSQMRLRLQNRLFANLRGSWGKYFKDDFFSGVMFGGGGRDLSTRPIHEFYGVNFSDLYGNEIRTARAQGEWEVYRAYSGSGLTPIYFKNFSLLGGVDYANSQRAFVAGRILREEDLISTHLGLRTNFNLGYLLPLTMDMIYSEIQDYQESNILLLIRGNISLI